MSILLTALLIAGSGALVAGATARALSQVKRRREQRSSASAAVTSEDDRMTSAGFAVAVGDVISIGTREAWLEHGWLLTETGVPVAAVLFCREGTVVALPAPRRTLYWLEDESLELPGEPPPALDVDGVRYERALRLPVDVEPLGTAPDPPWQAAVLAEYRGLGGESLFTLGRAQAVRAWRGTRVEPSELERWGRG